MGYYAVRFTKYLITTIILLLAAVGFIAMANWRESRSPPMVMLLSILSGQDGRGDLVFGGSWDCRKLPHTSLTMSPSNDRPNLGETISLKLVLTDGGDGTIVVAKSWPGIFWPQTDRPTRIHWLKYDVVDTSEMVEGPFDQHPFEATVVGTVYAAPTPGLVTIELEGYGTYDVPLGESLAIQFTLRPWRKCLGTYREEEQDLIHSNIVTLHAPSAANRGPQSQ